MICKECGKELKQISYNHLKYCCGLTPKQYKEKYNIEKLMNEEILKKCSHKDEKNGNWKGKKYLKYYCIEKNCDNEVKGENRRCIFCNSKFNNGFKNKHHSEETKMKMSENHHRWKNKINPFKNKHHSEETKILIGKKAKKRWKLYDENIKNKIYQGLDSGRKKHSKTKIEKIIEIILNELNLKYESNKQIYKYNVDFLINNTYIIECFGDYWHANPKYFIAENKHINGTALKVWKKDKIKIDFLKNNKYKILILWEFEIKTNDINYLKNKIKEFLCL